MRAPFERGSLLCRTALLLLTTACTGTPGGAAPSGDAATATAHVDSIVLERTVCFGFCPAYRLSIGGDGAVRFQRMAVRDSTPAAERDTIADSLVAQLLSRARAIEFFSLPDDITPNNQEACPQVATDHPSAIVTIAIGDTVKRVNHYHGCHANVGMNPAPAFPDLIALENAIDSAVRVGRWLEAGR